jgi:hypothetical protein
MIAYCFFNSGNIIIIAFSIRYYLPSPGAFKRFKTMAIFIFGSVSCIPSSIYYMNNIYQGISLVAGWA